MILMKEFVFLTTVAMEIGKIHSFNDHWKMLQEEKYLFKNMNLTKYHWKNWVDWILDTWWEKICNLKNLHFEKKSPKNLNKTKQFYILWLPWPMSLLK